MIAALNGSPLGGSLVIGVKLVVTIVEGDEPVQLESTVAVVDTGLAPLTAEPPATTTLQRGTTYADTRMPCVAVAADAAVHTKKPVAGSHTQSRFMSRSITRWTICELRHGSKRQTIALWSDYENGILRWHVLLKNARVSICIADRQLAHSAVE